MKTVTFYWATAISVLLFVTAMGAASPTVYMWNPAPTGMSDSRFVPIVRIDTIASPNPAHYCSTHGHSIDPVCGDRYASLSGYSAGQRAAAEVHCRALPAERISLLLSNFGGGSWSLESQCVGDHNNAVQLFAHPSDALQTPNPQTDPLARRTIWMEHGRENAKNWVREFVLGYEAWASGVQQAPVPSRIDLDTETYLRADISLAWFTSYIANDPRYNDSQYKVAGFEYYTLAGLYDQHLACLPSGTSETEVTFRNWYGSVCNAAQSVALADSILLGVSEAITSGARPEWADTVANNLSNYFFIASDNGNACQSESATVVSRPPFARREWRDPFPAGGAGGSSYLAFAHKNALPDHAPVMGYVHPSHKSATETTSEASLREYREQLDSIVQSPDHVSGSIVPWISGILRDGPNFPGPSTFGWEQGLAPIPAREHAVLLLGLMRSRGVQDLLWFNDTAGSWGTPSEFQLQASALTNAYGWSIGNAFVQSGQNVKVRKASGSYVNPVPGNLSEQLQLAEFERVLVDSVSSSTAALPPVSGKDYVAQVVAIATRQDASASLARLFINGEFGVNALPSATFSYAIRLVQPGGGAQVPFATGELSGAAGPVRACPRAVVSGGSNWMDGSNLLFVLEVSSNAPFTAWFDLAQTLSDSCQSSDPLPADYNHDGVVSWCDKTLFEQHHGSQNGTADVNCDGVVNASDFALFQTWYGEFHKLDLNRDGEVNIEDSCTFSLAYGAGTAHGDFNCDGALTPADWTTFAAEYLAKTGSPMTSCGNE